MTFQIRAPFEECDLSMAATGGSVLGTHEGEDTVPPGFATTTDDTTFLEKTA
jgi:hypothetical protein